MSTVSMPATGIVNQRERRQAFGAHPALDPGEYLAVEDGSQVILLPLHAGVLHIGRGPAAGLTLAQWRRGQRGAGEPGAAARRRRHRARPRPPALPAPRLGPDDRARLDSLERARGDRLDPVQRLVVPAGVDRAADVDTR